MVIDDGFLAQPSKIDFPGYEYYLPHNETLHGLTAHGDSLLREIIFPTEMIRAYNQKTTELIRQRAKKLTRKHPESADSLFRYVEQQERESEILETKVTGAIWLIQRA